MNQADRNNLLPVVLIVVLALLSSSCAYTAADVALPDGTSVHVWDNKSREGVIIDWKKTPEGYSVFLSSQKSGTDPLVGQVVGDVTGVLGKAIDKMPVTAP